MLIYSGLLPEYLKCLKEQKKITGSSYTWSPTTQVLKLKTRPFKFTVAICALVGGLRILQIAEGNSDTDSSGGIGELMLFMFTVQTFLIAHFTHDMAAHKETFEKLVSGMISFEDRYCKNGQGLTVEEKGKLKSAKIICKLMRIVGVQNTPFALALVAVTLTKLPMNVLVTQPGPWFLAMLESSLIGLPWLSKSAVWVIKKVVMFIINFWFHTLTYGYGVILCNQIIMGTNCMTVAVSMFGRRMQQLISGKQGDRTSIDLCQRTIQLYREIQLISCYFNQTHCLVMISMLTMAVLGQVVSALGLILVSSGEKAGDDGSVTTKYFLLTANFEGVVLTAICINSIFGFCGNLFDKSSKCLDDLNHQENLQQNKLLKRMVRSLPNIKIAFGRTNHVEKITPVVYQQFTNEKIVDTLLLRAG